MSNQKTEGYHLITSGSRLNERGGSVVAPFFETNTDYLFRVSARRPHARFDYVSTRPQSLSLFILVVLVIRAKSNLILHAP
jgi:hypothetical protein